MNIQSNALSTSTYTYWHQGNAAKAIICVSTAAGVLGGLISTQEVYEDKYGTVAQITTLAIPTLILVGNTVRAIYEKCHGRKIPKKILLPMPYLFGLHLAITTIAFKAQFSQCYNYLACPESKSWFVDECNQIMELCHETVANPNSWDAPFGNETIPTYWCNFVECTPQSRNWCSSYYDSLHTAAQEICQLVLKPDLQIFPLPCSFAWNLKYQPQMIIINLRQELYNTTHCSLSSETLSDNSNKKVLMYLLGVFGACASGGCSPLLWNKKIRPLRQYSVNQETDPILTALDGPQKRKKNSCEIILENL